MNIIDYILIIAILISIILLISAISDEDPNWTLAESWMHALVDYRYIFSLCVIIIALMHAFS